VDEYRSRHETLPSLRVALVQLAACADRLAAGDRAQPSRDAAAQYMGTLELAIGACVARPELGCWLDVLCPLKENLRSLGECAESVAPVPVDPALVTALVVLTHLALSLEQRPAETLLSDVLVDVMASSVWRWPLPGAARPELRAAFGHPTTLFDVSLRDSRPPHRHDGPRVVATTY
jgi:hypothetical protein